MILSICIPTYNRADKLKKVLNILIPQVIKYQDDIEIIISDNASDDNTAQMVSEFQNKFYNLRYSRNENNLGYDRNVDKSLTLGNGDFLWLLNSDELLQRNAIDYLINILKKNPGIAWVCIDKADEIKEYKMYNNGSDLLKEYGLVGGLMSQNIFNKKYLPENRSQYYDNLWIHYSIALKIAESNPLIFAKNIFIQEDAPCEWAKNGKAFFTFIYLKRIIESLNYDKNVKNKILNEMAVNFPKILASAKKRDLNCSSENLKLIIKEFSYSPIYMILGLFVFIVPNFVFKNL